MKTSGELTTIAQTGANLIIDAHMKTSGELAKIVEAAANSGGHIIIKNATKKTTAELTTIAASHPKSVTFDLT